MVWLRDKREALRHKSKAKGPATMSVYPSAGILALSLQQLLFSHRCDGAYSFHLHMIKI